MYHIEIRFVYCEELRRALADDGCCPLDIMKKCQLTKRVSSEHLPYDLKIRFLFVSVASGRYLPRRLTAW